MKTVAVFIVAVFTAIAFRSISAQEFYFCNYVDDNWNPVGASTTIKSSDGMNFLAKLDKKVYDQIYMWVIYKMDDSGKDDQFVNEFAMTVDGSTTQKGAKYFCTTEKIYLEPGKYRVYFIFENDKETSYKTGNFTKYLAKGEVTVE